MQDGKGKSASLRTGARCGFGQPGPGAAQGQVQAVAQGADSPCHRHCSPPDRSVFSPAQPSCSPHPSAHGLGGLPCGAWGEHCSSRGGTTSTAGPKSWDQSGMGREGARVAAAPHWEAGCHVAPRCSPPPRAGLHACCSWLPSVSPRPWGWLLTPQPHRPVLPPLSIPLRVHIAAVAAAWNIACPAGAVAPGTVPPAPRPGGGCAGLKDAPCSATHSPHHQHQGASLSPGSMVRAFA